MAKYASQLEHEDKDDNKRVKLAFALLDSVNKKWASPKSDRIMFDISEINVRQNFYLTCAVYIHIERDMQSIGSGRRDQAAKLLAAAYSNVLKVIEYYTTGYKAESLKARAVGMHRMFTYEANGFRFASKMLAIADDKANAEEYNMLAEDQETGMTEDEAIKVYTRWIETEEAEDTTKRPPSDKFDSKYRIREYNPSLDDVDVAENGGYNSTYFNKKKPILKRSDHYDRDKRDLN